MAESKKLSVATIVTLAVAVVGLILVIVGLCTDWISIAAAGESQNLSLGKIVEERELAEAMGMTQMYEGYDIMNAFAIITVVVGAIAVVGVVASVFVDVKAVKLAAGICGALALVCAIITLILTFVYTNNSYFATMKDAASAAGIEFYIGPAVGAWLLTVGGVICGAACGSVLRKAK